MTKKPQPNGCRLVLKGIVKYRHLEKRFCSHEFVIWFSVTELPAEIFVFIEFSTFVVLQPGFKMNREITQAKDYNYCEVVKNVNKNLNCIPGTVKPISKVQLRICD